MPDPIHLLLRIPPKFSISNTVGVDEEMIKKHIRDQDESYNNAPFEGASSYHVLWAWLVIDIALEIRNRIRNFYPALIVGPSYICHDLSSF